MSRVHAYIIILDGKYRDFFRNFQGKSIFFCYKTPIFCPFCPLFAYFLTVLNHFLVEELLKVVKKVNLTLYRNNCCIFVPYEGPSTTFRHREAGTFHVPLLLRATSFVPVGCQGGAG